jgi:hypothetical protein
MENALFYTFSTIAQTLAATIALLGAFVLYRLQLLGAELENAASTAIQPYLPNDEINRLRGENNYHDLVILLNTAVPTANTQAGVNNPYILSKRRALPTLLRLRRQIHGLMKVSLAFTMVLIASSVVVLSTTPLIATSANLTCSVFAIGVLLFVVCLVLYALLILKAVHES